jgi:hypothetical protein
MQGGGRKIGRNDPCPCGSGKKFKKCCAQGSIITKMEEDGLHVLFPDDPSSPLDLEEMTKAYQKKIRNSPIWDEIVQEYGLEKAEELLKEFRVKSA